MKSTFVSLAFASLTVIVGPAGAAVVGQVDTFQNGTTQNWVAGGGPNQQVPPVPPTVQLTGGPAGAGDAFLVVTAVGGNGPGSRLTTFNIFNQWADNYLTNGIAGISMDLINLGQTVLTIRFEFENPFAGGDEAVTNAEAVLNPGSQWTRFLFPIGLNQLTALDGTVAGALGNTTVLRIIHATTETDAEPVVGQLGVDNITAVAVPEPSTLYILTAGLLLLGTMRRRPVLSRMPRVDIDWSD